MPKRWPPTFPAVTSSSTSWHDGKTDERAARSMREVQGDLRVFALSGRAMIEARRRGKDLDGAVEAKVG